MKVGVVILSRFNSSRLPGKALMKIEDKEILSIIHERIAKVFPVEDILIATSVEKTDDAIENFAISKRFNYYRGSLENVAERFCFAALSKGFDYVIRINGDNIFLDIEQLKIMKVIAEEGRYDFISNVKSRTFPKGMSIEVVKVKHFQSLLSEINKEQKFREHVTLYLYENELESYRFVYNTDLPELAGIQLSLDTQEDLDRTRRIFSEMVKDHTFYNMKEINTILKNI